MSPPTHSASNKEPGTFGIDPHAARATWTAALTLLLLAALYAIRGTLFVFTVALLFAYLLYPLVVHISGRFSPKNRAPALALTYLLVIGILSAIAIGIGSRVAAEARQLVAQPPDVRGFLHRLELAHPEVSPAIRAAEGRIREQLGEIVSGAPRFSLRVLAASANLIDLIVIPILSFFMLKDGARIRDDLLNLFHPGSSREAAERTIAAIHILLMSYMRALLLLCCTVLVVFSVVLSAMGVPYALLLSSIAFLCEFVPLVGPISAAAVILAVSALNDYPHFWWLAAFLGGFRLLQDYGVSPKLMSRGVELHPILVIFGVFAGAELGGVAGVFLSVPVLALARLLVQRVSREQD
jgi:predicted PurR-regulated permease PerM